VQQNQTILIAPPDSLLIDPCKAKPAGDSLLGLAKGYTHNVGCIGLYKKQIQAIRDNKKAQEKLHHGK
jgi:hypothetical protein